MLYHHIIIYSPLRHVKIIRDPPKLSSEKIWPIKVTIPPVQQGGTAAGFGLSDSATDQMS